jgi:ketosteroid isomerase-like protein
MQTGIVSAPSLIPASHRRIPVTPTEKLAWAERSYAAFSDGLDIDALLPLYHPDCEWRLGHIGAALGTEAFRGHDGLRALVSALAEGFESYAAEIDEAKISHEGVLLLHGHVRSRSRGTHIELSMQMWQEIEFRDGLAFDLAQFDQPLAGWDEAAQIT